jgi:hypothetical protein
MESILAHYGRTKKTTPEEFNLNTQKKDEAIGNLGLKAFSIWAIPMSLTALKLMNRSSKNITLAMYTSYILAYGYSRYVVWDIKQKLDAVDNEFWAGPTQSQIAAAQNAEIIKLHLDK